MKKFIETADQQYQQTKNELEEIKKFQIIDVESISETFKGLNFSEQFNIVKVHNPTLLLIVLQTFGHEIKA